MLLLTVLINIRHQGKNKPSNFPNNHAEKLFDKFRYKKSIYMKSGT
jgi:hypothetical protein